MTILAENLCFYDSENGLNVPATVWAPQSFDQGRTITAWVPICDHEKDHWFEGGDWDGEFLPIDQTPPAVPWVRKLAPARGGRVSTSAHGHEDAYPWDLDLAQSRGWDREAHAAAVKSGDGDAIATTHPSNWLTEDEVEYPNSITLTLTPEEASALDDCIWSWIEDTDGWLDAGQGDTEQQIATVKRLNLVAAIRERLVRA